MLYMNVIEEVVKKMGKTLLPKNWKLSQEGDHWSIRQSPDDRLGFIIFSGTQQQCAQFKKNAQLKAATSNGALKLNQLDKIYDEAIQSPKEAPAQKNAPIICGVALTLG